MHYFILGGALFLSLALQATLFDGLTIQGVKPDFLLILIIIYALFKGSVSGAGLGFVYGLAEDLLLGRFIGINAGVKMLIGYMAGWGERRFYKDNILVPIVTIFIGTMVSHFLYVLFLTIVSGKSQFMLFRQFFLLFALYNTFSGLFIYRPFARFLTKGPIRSHRR